MKNFKKGFTLIELLVVLSIISLMSSIVLVTVNNTKNKANTAAVKQVGANIVRKIQNASLDGGGVMAPINNSTGGGVICSSCSDVETWPTIKSTGYVYNVTADSDISDGVFSFTMTKDNSPTIAVIVDTASARVVELSPVVIPALAVGDSYQGGIIAYIDGTGQHGLIVATSDQSAGASWGCRGSLMGAQGTAIGTGLSNTNAIINGCQTSTAAQISHSYSSGGFNDWYLPSKDELNQLYINRAVLSISNRDYWSSSEVDSNTAHLQFFSIGGMQRSTVKDNNFYVRAVRSF